VDANPLLPFVESDAQRVLLEVRPPDAPDLTHVTGLLAGAAEVDITPPPGMPKAGHSANAQTGTGFRTRLRAHVLHLRAGTTSLALVQCDLLAGSAIVAQLVAQAVAADTDVRLPGLFMGATHTHAGPGQFHGNELMNRYSSNHPGIRPGLDLVSGRADRRGSASGRCQPQPGPAGVRRHRGVGADPQPVARRARAQRERRGQEHRATA